MTQPKADTYLKAVDALRAEQPELSAVQAFRVIAERLGATPAAVQTGYYEAKRKAAGLPPRASRAKSPPARSNGHADQAGDIARVISSCEQAFRELATRVVVQEQEIAKLKADALALEEIRKVIAPEI